MIPRHYLDIEVVQHRPAALPIAAAALLRSFHAVFARTPRRYALALPDYGRGTFRRLRIFASDHDELDALKIAIEDSPSFQDHGRIGESASLPEDFTGPWATYARYRIPTRKQERNENGTVRLRRILAADAAELPFFPIASRTTGQMFRLYVQQLQGQPNEGNCIPDGYGLSVASRRFSVPALP